MKSDLTETVYKRIAAKRKFKRFLHKYRHINDDISEFNSVVKRVEYMQKSLQDENDKTKATEINLNKIDEILEKLEFQIELREREFKKNRIKESNQEPYKRKDNINQLIEENKDINKDPNNESIENEVENQAMLSKALDSSLISFSNDQ